MNNVQRSEYTESIKSFALTLHGYSPKAYRFIRETFMNILPHETTLSRWLTKLDVSPGFSAAALSHLSIIAKTEAVKGKNIFASLSLDEMKIKQSMSFDGQVFHGGVDLGGGPTEHDDTPATDAYVMMLTALNGRWKIPIAFFYINSLSATGKIKIYLSINLVIYLSI